MCVRQNMNMDMSGDLAAAGLGPVLDPRAPIEVEPSEWNYTMRREMQEIIPNIFLGSYASAMKKNFEQLVARGITHIICVREKVEARLVRPNFPNHFVYLTVEVADSSTENILVHFPMVQAFIDQALAGNGRVLLHGNAGISRSGALLIAYIMKTYTLGYTEALRVVQSRRFCVSPNEGFQAQLMEYEPLYKAQELAYQLAATRGGNGERRKRDFEEDDDELEMSVDGMREGPRPRAPHHPGLDAEARMQALLEQQERMQEEQEHHDAQEEQQMMDMYRAQEEAYAMQQQQQQQAAMQMEMAMAYQHLQQHPPPYFYTNQ